MAKAKSTSKIAAKANWSLHIFRLISCKEVLERSQKLPFHFQTPLWVIESNCKFWKIWNLTNLTSISPQKKRESIAYPVSQGFVRLKTIKINK
jgi:hypothetical protein